MKRKILVTFLIAATVLSSFGCSTKNVETTETEVLMEEETPKAFEDYKEDMQTHVAHFAPVEEGSTKYALSVVTKTTKEAVDNVDVNLQLKNVVENDARTIDTTSCAVRVDGNYYILTYAELDNVTSYEECEYVVSEYVPDTWGNSETKVDEKHADELADEATTEVATDETVAETETTEVVESTETPEATTETAAEEVAPVKTFTLELKEDATVLEGLEKQMFKTDDGNAFFLQMSYYKAEPVGEDDTKLNFMFLMHPINNHADAFDLSKFSLITTEDTPEDVLKNYKFELVPYNEEEHGKDLYFDSLYPCLNVSVTFNEQNIIKNYGEEASNVTNNCISYLGVMYEGENYTFTYIPSLDELSYQ